MATNYQIIFGNAGNATLQTADYATSYLDMDQLAEDVRAIEGGANPAAEWDGNDEDARIDTDAEGFWESARNGGYKVLDLDEIKGIESDQTWNNVADFKAAYWPEVTA